MAAGLGAVRDYLEGALGLSDAQLLRRFVASRDEGAFAALVRRHGGMVLGVCRRVLRHQQDAEDAFQATFLVLAARAGSIRRAASLGSWLHGVALRLARKARAAAARRPVCLPELEDRPAPAGADAWLWGEVRHVLDEEVGRLPEHYRGPFVLCHVEGRSNEAAAHALGCPVGTVASRLARARAYLARRLTRRGVGLPAGALVAALPPGLARATARMGLLWATGQATGAGASVLALALKGAKPMLAGKTKVVLAFVLAVGLVGGGAAALGGRSEVAEQAGAAPPPPQKADDRERPVAREKDVARPPEKAPPAVAPPKEDETRLDVIFREWARARAAEKTVRSRFTQVTTDRLFGAKTVRTGQVLVRRPDLLRIDWTAKEGPTETLLVTPRALHHYNYATRTERVFPRPERPRQADWVADFLEKVVKPDEQRISWMVAGPQPLELRAHYKVRLAKEDAWYIYLDVLPTRGKARADFTRMRVVLMRNDYRFRQVWVEHPNGEEMTIDYPPVKPAAPVTREIILAGLPRGWERVNVPAVPDGKGEVPAPEGPRK
jgi:RNA polymerase sigma factor (sigma-70 family)